MTVGEDALTVRPNASVPMFGKIAALPGRAWICVTSTVWRHKMADVGNLLAIYLLDNFSFTFHGGGSMGGGAGGSSPQKGN